MSNSHLSPLEAQLANAEAQDPYTVRTAGMSQAPDVAHKIEKIARWSDQGLKHPKSVADLLKAAEEVKTFNRQAPSWDGVTSPKTALKVLEAHADHAAIPDVAELKSQALRIIWSSISEAVNNDIDTYMEQLEKVFNPAADAYEAAIEALPEQLSWESIVADDELAGHYRKAIEAVAVIEAAQHWVTDLRSLGLVYVSQAVKPLMYVVTPSDAAQLAVVMDVHKAHEGSPESKLNPALVAAVQAGAVLSVSTPEEAEENLRAIAAQADLL